VDWFVKTNFTVFLDAFVIFLLNILIIHKNYTVLYYVTHPEDRAMPGSNPSAEVAG
jgi:hypothetical protein